MQKNKLKHNRKRTTKKSNRKKTKRKKHSKRRRRRAFRCITTPYPTQYVGVLPRGSRQGRFCFRFSHGYG